MQRHETRIDGGRLYVADGDGGWLDVGSMADIYEVTGGETVQVQFEQMEAVYAENWMDTDEDNVLTIDVRETLAEMTFPSTFVEKLATRDLRSGPDGVPERTSFFADAMVRAWQSRGDFEDGENPFR